MRVSSSFKAIFLIFNHISATTVPRNVLKPAFETAGPPGDIDQAFKSEPINARFGSMDMFSLLTGRQSAKVVRKPTALDPKP